MSFSFSFTADSKGEARDKVDALPDNVPGAVRVYVKDGIDALDLGGRAVTVSGYGHLHDGHPGNQEETTVTVSVKPVQGE